MYLKTWRIAEMPIPQRGNSPRPEAHLNANVAGNDLSGSVPTPKAEQALNSSNGAILRAIKSDTHTFELSILSNVPSKESESILGKVGRSVGIDFYGYLFSGEVKVTSYEGGGCRLLIRGGTTSLDKLHPLCLKASECKDFVSVLVRQADYKS